MLMHDSEERMDAEDENTRNLEKPAARSVIVGRTNRDYSPLHLGGESSSFITVMDSRFKEKDATEVCSELDHAVINAKNAKQITFEESIRRWRAEEDASRAEEDASVAEREVETAEGLIEEETNRRIELEELLLRQSQDTEMLADQHAQCLRELKLIQDQNSSLKIELGEAQSSEQELEDKIIQAVNLLVRFREKRDKLSLEYDSAIREVRKYKVLNGVDGGGRLSGYFFGISFSDIIKATQNFKPSHKVGEGKYGSVYKGIVRHVKVAIKMLPSSGSQSDEFRIKVEILSRVRHPNLVTLLGACLESRTLIYEFINNYNLEDYLANPSKTCSLSWQTRIRIATEICSVLLFIHANNSCNVHGNLKPSNILLCSNFVTKISDFGIHSLMSSDKNSLNLHTFRSKNDPAESAYMDPESHEAKQLTTESDVYSLGVILLQLLTARPATGVVRDVKLALERGNIETFLDFSAGNWPVREIKQLAYLAVSCCEKNRLDRPNLESEIWAVLEPMSKLCNSSELASKCLSTNSSYQQKIPSHFLCPIFQEVMKDPLIAGDGFTYEGDAIKGWFNSGHDTSPMTNLKLGDCGLTPNYALYYAIQEWQQNT